MVTVNEDKADTNDYCKNVRNEVEACKDPGRRLEDGDDNDGEEMQPPGFVPISEAIKAKELVENEVKPEGIFFLLKSYTNC